MENGDLSGVQGQLGFQESVSPTKSTNQTLKKRSGKMGEGGENYSKPLDVYGNLIQLLVLYNREMSSVPVGQWYQLEQVRKGNLCVMPTAPQRLITNSKTVCPSFLWRWWEVVQQVRSESPIPDHLASGHYYFLSFMNCPITLYPSFFITMPISEKSYEDEIRCKSFKAVADT